MAIRSLTQIINDAISYLTGKRPDIATFSGTVTRDVVIESPAQEMSTIYTELSHTQQLQSITFASALSTDELDALGANYGLVRLIGRAATGTITFRIRSYNTSSANITIPTGTIVATQPSSTIAQSTFSTTQPITFLASLAPSYFNPVSGAYEQTATIQCIDVGVLGNVAAGTITHLVSGVTGIDAIYNTVATTGGTDIESNTQFALRIQTKLSGNNVGTTNGIISILRANPNVQDAIVVTPNDPEMLRSEFGGEVDAYILGQVISTATQINLYQTTGVQQFILQHEPALAIVSITGVAGGLPYTFVQGLDFNYIPDPSILVNGSTRLQSRIVFNIGGTNPDDSTNITISYTYNSLVESLQTQFDADSGHIVTSDVLVKEAEPAIIDIIADVILFPGYISSTEIANIQTAISSSINVLGLGKSIDRSDIITLIESVPSVDQVNVNTLVIKKNGVPLGATDQRVTIFKTEYAQIGTISINI